MQELELVPDDSDSTSLVLRAVRSSNALASTAPEDEEKSTAEVPLYWVPVTEKLRQLLTTDKGNDNTDGTMAAVLPLDLTPRPAPVEKAPTDVTAPERAPRETLKLRPRDIQKRLRHGATVAELSAESGIPESRLLPYTHPIDMERDRIAELARQAYPIRADGPAEHTLWEVLATSFGARGEDVRAATWNAAMDSSDAWIVSVAWTRGNRPGATEFIAEFRWIPASPPGVGPTTVEPANSVASDLIDPRFSRPVRSMGLESTSHSGTDGEDQELDFEDYPDNTTLSSSSGPADLLSENLNNDTTAHTTRDGQSGHPAKRRRSAATPHWEDVLLGVRTPPRRKK